MLDDLEDTILLVPGISSDIVSDIATNVIREPLIRYTAAVAEYFGIPLENDVDSGPLWNPVKRVWESGYVKLPVTPHGKLLLIPKSLVRRKMDYDLKEYYRDYMIEHLRHVEESANSELVHLLRDGRRRVYVTELEEKYGTGKHAVVRLSREYPDVLDRYRADKKRRTSPPLSNDEIAPWVGAPEPDWDALLADVTRTRRGKDAADDYHRAVERMLTALFYPHLTGPEIEFPIHDGRKRIDIRYTNAATSGFFDWLGSRYPAPYVFVECKNYTGDPANPELDQLAGRFSPRRGRFGLLVCRTFKDKARFVDRCKDTARDDRGFIIALDDADLVALVADYRARGALAYDVLQARFDELIN